MKHLSIVFIFTCISFVTFAQTKQKRLTDKHINIVGTPIYIIAPPSFVNARIFPGLSDTISDATIVVKKNNNSTIDLNKAKSRKQFGTTVLYFKKLINNKEYHFLEIQLNPSEYYLIESSFQESNSNIISENIQKALSTVIVL